MMCYLGCLLHNCVSINYTSTKSSTFNLKGLKVTTYKLTPDCGKSGVYTLSRWVKYPKNYDNKLLAIHWDSRARKWLYIDGKAWLDCKSIVSLGTHITDRILHNSRFIKLQKNIQQKVKDTINMRNLNIHTLGVVSIDELNATAITEDYIVVKGVIPSSSSSTPKYIKVPSHLKAGTVIGSLVFTAAHTKYSGRRKLDNFYTFVVTDFVDMTVPSEESNKVRSIWLDDTALDIEAVATFTMDGYLNGRTDTKSTGIINEHNELITQELLKVHGLSVKDAKKLKVKNKAIKELLTQLI